MRVVFDTNIIQQDFRMANSAFRAFFSELTRAGHSLFVSEVVVDEILDNYVEKLEKLYRSVEELGRLAAKDFDGPFDKSFLETIEADYKKLLADRFRSVQARYLPYPNITHKQMAQRAIKHRKPFSEKGTGYQDALIWESILELASDGNQEPIVFICNNPKDFADDKDQLHPDLLQDVHLRDKPCSQIIIIRELQTFIDKYIKPTLEVLESVRRQLEEETFPGLNLRSFLQEELLGIIGSKEVDALDLCLPNEFETVTLASIEEVSEIGDIDARALSGGEELLISFSAKAEGSFDFFIFKPDFYSLSERILDHISVWDSDWNEHYMACVVTLEAVIKIELIFDKAESKVTSAQITEIYSEGMRFPEPISLSEAGRANRAKQFEQVGKILAEISQDQLEQVKNTIDAIGRQIWQQADTALAAFPAEQVKPIWEELAQQQLEMINSVLDDLGRVQLEQSAAILDEVSRQQLEQIEPDIFFFRGRKFDNTLAKIGQQQLGQIKAIFAEIGRQHLDQAKNILLEAGKQLSERAMTDANRSLETSMPEDIDKPSEDDSIRDRKDTDEGEETSSQTGEN